MILRVELVLKLTRLVDHFLNHVDLYHRIGGRAAVVLLVGIHDFDTSFGGREARRTLALKI